MKSPRPHRSFGRSASAIGTVLLTIVLTTRVESRESARVDFTRDVRPILSENCLPCHGPDREVRKARLRLDVEGEAKRRRGRRAPAITPKDRDASSLWLRVHTDDEDDVMPPRDSKLALTPAQIETLGRWIDQGAEYAEHWSFVRPKRSEVGPTEGAKIAPVDAFVRRKLADSKLEPSPRADRRTLLRRWSLDLTGVPPALDEIRSFLEDDSPFAHEKVIDRLLASPRFGARWARPWLDLARYADSNGFQADQLRDSWAYRDWLIDALNGDKPFDEFTIEQIAGDLLPASTIADRVATGFHRTVTCNVEAGVHPEANRVDQIVDRVNTTATVWLGLTLECSQCHDHKYDPLSMEDYYRFFAYFNNTPIEVSNPSGKGVQFNFYGPKMDLPLAPDVAARKRSLDAQIRELGERRSKILADRKSRSAWERRLLEDAGTPASWHVLEVSRFDASGGEISRPLEDGSVLVGGPIVPTTTYTIRTRAKLANVTAIRLDALTHDELPGKGPGRGDAKRTNFVLNRFIAELVRDTKKAPLEFRRASASFSQKSWPVANAIDGKPKTGWAIAPRFHEPHHAIFELEKPISIDAGAELVIRLVQDYGQGRTIGRVKLSARVGGGSAAPESIAKILRKKRPTRSKKERAQVEKHFAASNDEVRAIDKKRASLQKEIATIRPSTTLVMIEDEKPRETRVLMRGDYLRPQDKVAAGTPAILASAERHDERRRTRLDLAKWLVSPGNPLVARVTVNRWWAELFGRGIVTTLEDFGTQGAAPTHPELLDWLALEYVESGWSLRHVLRTIVSSDTYAQSSTLTADGTEIDPTNSLYARGPRFRMSAEMIRDNALAISGLLDETQRGPPVMPYQPPKIWRHVGRNGPTWNEAKDGRRFRRGVYVIFRRAAPYPSFVTFDAPDRSTCVVGRPRTNTPLQALALLNDPAYTEMAVALAVRVVQESGTADPDDRLRYAFESVLSRSPRAVEHGALKGLLFAQLEQLQSSPQTVAAIVDDKNRAYRVPKSVDRVEVAAWYFVASALLNLDETITKD